MTEPTPKKHGGTFERLPEFDLKIHNYAVYHPKLTSGRQRAYCTFMRGMLHELVADGYKPHERSIFYDLILLSDEGEIAGTTTRKLATLLLTDYRTVESALDKLTEPRGKKVPRIAVSGEYRSSEGQAKKLAKGKSKARAEQEQDKRFHSESKSGAREGQAISLERPADSAILRAPYKERDIEREGEGISGSQEGGLPAPEVSPFSDPINPADETPTSNSASSLIEKALAAKAIPPRGADATAFYRAEAYGFISRKPAEIRNDDWASWVCMAIAAVDPDKYPIAVHDCLKRSKLARAFIPPEDTRPTGRRASADHGAPSLVAEYGV